MDKLQEVLKIIGREPNREEFEFQGYNCLIKRNMMSGSLCGYVAVAEGHKYYGQDQDNEPLCNIKVHGGITWSGHIEEENPKLWYIGFDCAHYQDLMPFMAMAMGITYERMLDDQMVTYKDFEYVKHQLRNMVNQLNKDVKNSP